MNGSGSQAVAPGGDGFVIGTGRVHQARKMPVRFILLVLAGLAAVVSAAAAVLAWAGSDMLPALAGAVPGAITVATIATTVVLVAVVALLLEFIAPHECWSLIGSRAGRTHFAAARRFALWWPRKSGQCADAVLADNGKRYRPSVQGFVLGEGGELVAVMILPNVLRGTTLDIYLERLCRLGPDVFGFHTLELVAVESSYWSTRVLIRLVHTDHAARVRHVASHPG